MRNDATYIARAERIPRRSLVRGHNNTTQDAAIINSITKLNHRTARRSQVRTQITDDESYGAVFQCEDADGLSGVRLSKQIVQASRVHIFCFICEYILQILSTESSIERIDSPASVTPC